MQDEVDMSRSIEFSMFEEQSDSMMNILEVEAADEDEQAGLNPLLLPEIASNVLRFVDSNQTLLACRYVSRIWKAESTKVIRSKQTVYLMTVSKIHEYYSTMCASEDLPHEIFNLSLLLMDLSELRALSLNSFITTFGPHIKHLKLSLNEEFSSPNDWWTLLYNCNNLEKLSVRIFESFTHPFGADSGGMTLFVERKRFSDFFDQRHFRIAQMRNEITEVSVENEINPPLPLHEPIAPRLQLKIQHFVVELVGSQGNMENILQFFKSIFRECSSSLLAISCANHHTEIFLGNILYTSLISTASELDGGFRKLRNLQFWFKPSNPQLKQLWNFSQLKCLKMVLGSEISDVTIHKVISTCFSTLEHLELIFQGPTSLKGAISVPGCMKRLKYLKLFGHDGLLEFLHYAPALEEVHVLGIKLKFLIDQLPQCRKNSSLKRIKVFRSDGFMDIRNVSGTTDCFNKIMSLELSNSTNEALDMIYQTMPNLQELKISGTFTDEGICGIPEHMCKEITQLQAHFIADDTKLRQFVFIGCLLKLKRLSIMSDVMTDISVMFGVARIKNLEELVISGELITEKSAEVICNFMVLKSVDASGCKNLTQESLSKFTTQSWWKDLLNRKKSTTDHNADQFLDQLLAFRHLSLIHAERDREAVFEQLRMVHHHLMFQDFLEN